MARPPQQPFKTDSLVPSSLPSATLGRRRAHPGSSSAQGSGLASSSFGIGHGLGLGGDEAEGSGSGSTKAIEERAQAVLEKEHERWNERIDKELKGMVDGLKELVKLADISTNPSPLTPSTLPLHLPLRTSSLIRSAQNIRDIAHELKLLLLLGDESGTALRRDHEARAVREEVGRRREGVIRGFEGLLGVGRGDNEAHEEGEGKDARDEKQVIPEGEQAGNGQPETASGVEAAANSREIDEGQEMIIDQPIDGEDSDERQAGISIIAANAGRGVQEARDEERDAIRVDDQDQKQAQSGQEGQEGQEGQNGQNGQNGQEGQDRHIGVAGGFNDTTHQGTLEKPAPAEGDGGEIIQTAREVQPGALVVEVGPPASSAGPAPSAPSAPTAPTAGTAPSALTAPTGGTAPSTTTTAAMTSSAEAGQEKMDVDVSEVQVIAPVVQQQTGTVGEAQPTTLTSTSTSITASASAPAAPAAEQAAPQEEDEDEDDDDDDDFEEIA